MTRRGAEWRACSDRTGAEAPVRARWRAIAPSRTSHPVQRHRDRRNMSDGGGDPLQTLSRGAAEPIRDSAETLWGQAIGAPPRVEKTWSSRRGGAGWRACSYRTGEGAPVRAGWRAIAWSRTSHPVQRHRNHATLTLRRGFLWELSERTRDPPGTRRELCRDGPPRRPRAQRRRGAHVEAGAPDRRKLGHRRSPEIHDQERCGRGRGQTGPVGEQSDEAAQFILRLHGSEPEPSASPIPPPVAPRWPPSSVSRCEETRRRTRGGMLLARGGEGRHHLGGTN